MASHANQVGTNDAIFSIDIFSIKEEPYEEDNFIEDKVCISETAITPDNAELEDSIWHGIIKQYQESTCFDDIKREMASFGVSDIQNDNVKVAEGMNTPDIKIEFDNGQLYCEHCEAYYQDYCIKCGMLVHVLNKYGLNNGDSGAQEDIPTDILEIRDRFGQTGIYALRIIPAGVKFGPFTGRSPKECPWEMKGEKFVLDKSKWKHLNWMQYINPTNNISERNLCVFHRQDNIYYQSTRPIQTGEELLVYFGREYRIGSNKIVRIDFVTTTKDIFTDVYACTFCCLGFSSKSQLAKHKTICVENTAGKFSNEDLTQCTVCKIHLNPKEHLEHHMTFCSERNARKHIPPIPPPNEATTTALNGRKKYPRAIYKCKQCKYKAKYQADLRDHTNNQHYPIKINKCRICNRRFKTKESLRLHIKNTHSSVGGRDDQEHSTIDHRNTHHTKVKQSNTKDRKKIFRCFLCAFRAKRKSLLRRHIRNKHLKDFNHKCDFCEFRTNIKHNLEYHIKTKHLKQFDYECYSCEFKTNVKLNIEYHIKTNHLKEFDYKCHSCEYETNNKSNLEIHIKNIHLKEFDYKCDSCEFGTNSKNYLDHHVKTKHLKEFDHKCESCEFRSNSKCNLKRHMNTMHLKKFDYKCDACEFATNTKHHLDYHIKTKHLKKFDFKCDSCEFETNTKCQLDRHMKTKHLKKFDFKCNSCEFTTNIKHKLEYHIKNKHLKQFDHKCDSCDFKSNSKCNLTRHVKTKHLKTFDYKCDSCEFGTNSKHHFDYHIKTIHLKKFDFKCDSCKFETNNKCQLEIHTKTMHLKKFDYKCDSCEFTTNIKSKLEYHTKTKHLKK